MLHGGLHTAGHSGGWGAKELGVSLGRGLSFESEWSWWWRGWGITENVHYILAQRLVLNLLSLHDNSVADVLSPGGAGLGHQDLVGGHAVGGGSGANGAKLGISLGLCSWCSEAATDEQDQSDQLKQFHD